MSGPKPDPASSAATWRAENQAYLELALAGLRLRLQRRVGWLRHRWLADPLKGHPEVISDQQADGLLAGENWADERRFYAKDKNAAEIGLALRATEQQQSALAFSRRLGGTPPALELLAQLFGLNAFEEKVVLLCFAPEYDPAFAELFAYVQDHAGRRYPTAHLAITLLAGDDDARELAFNSFLPDAPLRRFALLELEPGPFPATAQSARPLLLAPRIAAYIRGINQLDTQLSDLLKPSPSVPLSPPQQDLVERLEKVLQAHSTSPRVLNLVGEPGIGKQAVAKAACARLGLTLARLDAARLPGPGPEQRQMLRCLQRESVLLQLAFYIEGSAVNSADKATESAVQAVIEWLPSLVVVGSEERFSADRELLVIRVPKPAPSEQRLLWQQALAKTPHTVSERIEAVVQQFHFGPQAVVKSVAAARDLARLRSGNEDAPVSFEDLWQACRAQSGPRLDQLGQRIISGYTWADIVLSDDLLAQLRELSAQVANRNRVYEKWGFGARLSRGRGISALFAGPSGTGKTMAAEVLANALQLDLYRIDLSGVVSKYIGETEKNLKLVFDAAEQSGVILFFDEADALFGKRTEVKDSHDRYANIEVNYLLQRMEDYRGLAILATNRKSALDRAFLRRLRFLMDFPFPDADSRRRIWEKVFPADTPLDRLDHAELARLEIPGGNIRNIALNAAFLAAGQNQPVSMAHLAHAARREYIKIDKMVTAAEFGARYREFSNR